MLSIVPTVEEMQGTYVIVYYERLCLDKNWNTLIILHVFNKYSIHKERSFQLSYNRLFSCSFKQNLLYAILVSPVHIFNANVVENSCSPKH